MVMVLSSHYCAKLGLPSLLIIRLRPESVSTEESKNEFKYSINMKLMVTVIL